MRVGTLLAVAAVLLGSARAVSAQVVSLEFRNGVVRLVAENASVSSILAEWARLGRTTFVNGDRVPGAPVSLVLEDVPEQEALSIILRRASGYVSGARASTADGPSMFDRVFILPTSSPVLNTAPPPQPAPPPAFLAPEEDVAADVGPTEVGADGTPEPSPFNRQPRGGPPRELLGPDVPPEVVVDEPEDAPPTLTPGNPFGVVPGSARPGIVSPVPGPGPASDRNAR